ncbi:MAG TPA: alginate export family protein [Methylobacter sp.]|jgi:hypothetical protein
MMRIKSLTGVTVSHTLSLIAAGGFCLGQSVDAVQAAEPQQSYSRAPMAAYNFMMQDPLLGNSYEKPVWNLHDTLGLPEWLSVGLEQRTRYESLANTFKGSLASPAPTARGGDQQIAFQSDLWLQARLGKFRFATEFLDARTTLSDSGTNNIPNPPNNSTTDTFDFAQGYISWADQNTFFSGKGVEIKVGRQTMDLGSRRLVARPIFRNTVNNFTGVRLRVIDYDRWQFNAFVTMPVLRYPTYNSVTPDANMMNHQKWDEEDTHTWFSGGILEGNKLYKDINAEMYLYHLDEGDNPRNPTRNRRYFTPGIRLFQKPSKSNFDFTAEGIGQFGTVNYAATSTFSTTQQRHEAWSSHSEAGYSFDLPWSPRFYLEHDYAGGSKNWKDHSAGAVDSRFDPLYGASDFDFGPTGIYGAFQRSNINSPGYKLDFSPHKDVSFRLQQRLIWLASGGDCWGGAACTAATTPGLAGGNGRYVGDQVGVTGRYNFNSSLNFDAGWYHLFKGDFAKTAKPTNATGATQTLPVTPGADTDYFFVTSQLRF